MGVKMRLDAYDALVAAFRERPGDCKNAAAKAGTSWRTASKMWHEGMGTFPAISRALEGEIAQRRAIAGDLAVTLEANKAAAMFEVARFRDEVQAECAAVVRQTGLEVQARLDVLHKAAHVDERESIEREIGISRSVQTGVLLCGTLLQRLADGRIPERLSAAVFDALESAVGPEKLSPRSAMWLVGSLGRFTKDLAEAGQRSLELERLRLGAPTQIVEEHHVELSMDDTEYKNQLRKLLRQAAAGVEREPVEYVRRLLTAAGPALELLNPFERQIRDTLEIRAQCQGVQTSEARAAWVADLLGGESTDAEIEVPELPPADESGGVIELDGVEIERLASGDEAGAVAAYVERTGASEAKALAEVDVWRAAQSEDTEHDPPASEDDSDPTGDGGSLPQ